MAHDGIKCSQIVFILGKGWVFYTLDPACVNGALIKGFEYSCKLLQIIAQELWALRGEVSHMRAEICGATLGCFFLPMH